MNHPQTTALKWAEIFDSKILRTIGDFGCCAFCALYIVNPYLPDVDAIKTIAEEIGRGLDTDCTVRWHDFVANVTGKDSSVKFIDIDGIQDTKNCAQKMILRFDYNGKSHWVVAYKGHVIFNPLEKSVCVEKGKAATARLLEIDR